MQGISIAGRKVNDGIDFYATPEWAVDKICEVAKLEGIVMEPCSGNGAFASKIPNCVASDIRTDADVYGEKGVDLFDIPEGSADVVITNPPHCIAQEVIEHCLKIANKRVYMLLKLSFLEGIRRKEFYENTPLKKVYVFRRRVNMYPANMEERPKNSGTIAYALYEWEHGYTGEPTIGWL